MMAGAFPLREPPTRAKASPVRSVYYTMNFFLPQLTDCKFTNEWILRREWKFYHAAMLQLCFSMVYSFHFSVQLK